MFEPVKTLHLCDGGLEKYELDIVNYCGII